MARTPNEMRESLYGLPARLKYLYGEAGSVITPTTSEAEIDTDGFILQPPGAKAQGQFHNTGDQDVTVKLYQNQISNDEYDDDDSDWVHVGTKVIAAGGKEPITLICDHERITFTTQVGSAITNGGGIYGTINVLGDIPETIPRPA